MTAAEAITRANRTASWAARAGAFAVDLLPGAAVLTSAALVALSVPHGGALWWVCVAVAAVATLWTAFNRILLPGMTGASVGRAAFGTSVVNSDGGKAGPARLLLRDAAHVLDTLPVLAGWFWPLRDSRQRTFADALAHTESHSVDSLSTCITLRSLITPVMITAAALCATGAAVSDLVVRQHDQAVADTTAQIAIQGPHMVVQILSYHPETINGDFDHARSLTTDRYRVELSALQQTTLKSGPVVNEYWVTRSSVLDATPDRATMLLFLQGQRGAPPNQRDIAASVRATFVKSDRACWRIDDVAVVTEPQITGAKS